MNLCTKDILVMEYLKGIKMVDGIKKKVFLLFKKYQNNVQRTKFFHFIKNIVFYYSFIFIFIYFYLLIQFYFNFIRLFLNIIFFGSKHCTSIVEITLRFLIKISN